MAKQDIQFAVTTTGDTSGVEKVDNAFVKLNGTVSVSTVDDFLSRTSSKVGITSAAFYDLDAAVTKTGNSGDKLEPLVAKIKRVEDAVKPAATGVKNLSNVATQAGYQITDFAVQVQGGTSAVTAFSQQFPQLIGSLQQSGIELSKIRGGLLQMPIDIGTSISIGAVAIGIGAQMALKAYDGMKAAEADLAKARERAVKQIGFQAAAMAQLRAAERSEFIASVFEREAAALERQEKAQQRLNELRAAQGTTAEAQANLAVTQAQNNGGNVVAAQGNAIAVGVSNKIAEVQGQLKTAENTAAEASLNLEKAGALLAAEAIKGDQNLQSFKDANTAFDKAQEAKDNADANAELQRQKYDESLKQIDANTTANLSNLATQANAAQTKSAQDTLAALEAKSAEVGGNLSSNAKQAIQDLTKALADGVVQANESSLVADAINQVKASREGADQRILTVVQSLATSQETILKTLPSIETRIAKIEADARAFANSARY